MENIQTAKLQYCGMKNHKVINFVGDIDYLTGYHHIFIE